MCRVGRCVQVSYKSSNGATPLHQAAGGGHAAVCEVLLEAGCPVMGRWGWGWPHGASRADSRTPGWMDSAWTGGMCGGSAQTGYALIQASSGNGPGAQRSFPPGLLPCHRLASGATALYCAAAAGWEEAAEVLLRAGSEVDAATTSGCTALHAAATNGHAKVGRSCSVPSRLRILRSRREAQSLRNQGASYELLTPHAAPHRAAPLRAAQVMALLLTEGADPDVATSSNGHTPLHNAASGGHVDAAEALIAAGADLDAQNSGNGNTPLHIAASKGGLRGSSPGPVLPRSVG